MDELEAMFKAEILEFWEITSVEIVSSRNDGTRIAPLVSTAIHLKATPAETLYSRARKIDDVVFLEPTMEKGEEIIVRGFAQSSYRDGEWETRLTIRENASLYSGRPASGFSQPLAVVGSLEETRFLEERSARITEPWQEILGRRFSGQLVHGMDPNAPRPMVSIELEDYDPETGQISGEVYWPETPPPGRRIVGQRTWGNQIKLEDAEWVESGYGPSSFVMSMELVVDHDQLVLTGEWFRSLFNAGTIVLRAE